MALVSGMRVAYLSLEYHCNAMAPKVEVYTVSMLPCLADSWVYTSTFGAIALQWYSKLKYATRIPLTNAIGGLIVSSRFYKKLPEDLQQLLKTTGKAMSDEIRLNAREENRESIGILEKNGIEFMFDWDEVNMDEILAIRDNAAAYLEQTDYIPASVFAKTEKLLTEYRNQQVNASDTEPEQSQAGPEPSSQSPAKDISD